MDPEKPSFLSTTKGKVTVVVSVIGAAVLLILGFGYHQGWFAKKTDGSNPGGTNQDRTNTDNTNTDGKDKEDAKKLQMLAQEPSELVLDEELTNKIVAIFEKEETTEDERHLLYSLLKYLKMNPSTNLRISKVDSDGDKSKSSLKKEDIFPRILPECIKSVLKKRGDALSALYADPENQAKLDQCKATHKALFEALETFSEIVKKELAATTEDLCESYRLALAEDIIDKKILNFAFRIYPVQELQNKYLSLQRMCPGAYTASYDDFQTVS